MATILGYLRLGFVAMLFVGEFFAIMLASLTGLKHKGIGLGLWTIGPVVRAALWAFRVNVTCHDVERLRNFQGVILTNHQSYLDIFLLFAFIPVRFMAAIEVRNRPLLGWMSEAIGCVFIERGNTKSGRAVKEQVAQSLATEPDPPLVIFPEGRMGDGLSLHKFRRGTFRIVTANEIPYLLCAIKYDKPRITTWYGSKGESMIAAIRRLVMYGKPIHAELIPLKEIHPKAADKPHVLATEARQIVADGLIDNANKE